MDFEMEFNAIFVRNWTKSANTNENLCEVNDSEENRKFYILSIVTVYYAIEVDQNQAKLKHY